MRYRICCTDQWTERQGDYRTYCPHQWNERQRDYRTYCPLKCCPPQWHESLTDKRTIGPAALISEMKDRQTGRHSTLCPPQWHERLTNRRTIAPAALRNDMKDWQTGGLSHLLPSSMTRKTDRQADCRTCCPPQWNERLTDRETQQPLPSSMTWKTDRQADYRTCCPPQWNERLTDRETQQPLPSSMKWKTDRQGDTAAVALLNDMKDWQTGRHSSRCPPQWHERLTDRETQQPLPSSMTWKTDRQGDTAAVALLNEMKDWQTGRHSSRCPPQWHERLTDRETQQPLPSSMTWKTDRQGDTAAVALLNDMKDWQTGRHSSRCPPQWHERLTDRETQQPLPSSMTRKTDRQGDTAAVALLNDMKDCQTGGLSHLLPSSMKWKTDRQGDTAAVALLNDMKDWQTGRHSSRCPPQWHERLTDRETQQPLPSSMTWKTDRQGDTAAVALLNDMKDWQTGRHSSRCPPQWHERLTDRETQQPLPSSMTWKTDRQGDTAAVALLNDMKDWQTGRHSSRCPPQWHERLTDRETQQPLPSSMTWKTDRQGDTAAVALLNDMKDWQTGRHSSRCPPQWHERLTDRETQQPLPSSMTWKTDRQGDKAAVALLNDMKDWQTGRLYIYLLPSLMSWMAMRILWHRKSSMRKMMRKTIPTMIPETHNNK